MIRLGVIGCGQRLHGFIKDSLRLLEPDLRVVGIIDPNEKTVRERLDERERADAVFYKTLPDLVRKARPDALAIGTLCKFHTPYAVQAAHDFDYMSYLMGSPITRVAAMASLGRVFGGCKRAGLVCFRCQEQKQCLESPANRRRNQSGGISGDHPCLFSRDQGSPKTGMNEDASSALLEFTSGAHGVYTQVFYSRRDAGARGATVSGYLGTVSFNWFTNELKRVRHHAPFTDMVKAGAGLSHFGGDAELARNFLDVIRGTAKSRTPISLGLQSVYACLAAKESAGTGRFVRVRQVRL